MIRRPRRAVPAALTAFVLLAISAVLAMWIVQALTGRQPPITYAAVAEAARGIHWNDLVVAIAGGLAALVGLVLLIAAIAPGKPTVIPLDGGDAGASSRSLRSTLRAAADSVDGVRSTKLRLGRKRITATVRTNRTSTDGLADAVRTAVEQRLGQISPATTPSLRIKARSAR